MQTHPSLQFAARAANAQRGAALLAALIFLIVFTIIGVGVVGTTTTEEKLARNFRDMDIALASAEAALRDAEVRVNGYWSKPALPIDPYSFSSTCTNGLCDRNAEQPVHEKFSLTGSPSVEIGAGTTGTPQITQVSAQPRYLIESTCGNIPGESATKPCQTIYRITSLGFGRLSAQTMLQETYIP